MERNLNEVLGWLGRDSAGASYHLVPLNLTWSAAGVDGDLAVFAGVAERLAADRPLWSALLRETNWRYSLVGCVCLLVSGDDNHFEDLAWRFSEGSWVSPQLAVTLGVLHPERTRELLTRLLAESALSPEGKAFGAAQVVLDRLGGQAVEPADRQLSEGAAEGASVATAHWAFWSERLGRDAAPPQ